MSDTQETNSKKSFWETLPGLLTAIAAVLTSLTGFVAIFISNNKNEAQSETKSVVAKEIPQSNIQRAQPSVPTPTTVAQMELSGLWKDTILGNNVHVTQQGKQIITTTVHPYTNQRLAQGHGNIQDRKINGENIWMDGSKFSVSLTVSEDGNDITGTYRNFQTNESGMVHLTR